MVFAISTGAGGGGALAGAQHLAGVRMAWHEGTESLAAEKPHHPPRIGPTSQPGDDLSTPGWKIPQRVKYQVGVEVACDADLTHDRLPSPYS